VNGERKTGAVCHCHEFHTFALLGLSDFALLIKVLLVSFFWRITASA
jgi:hypothetical protein